MFGDVFIMTTIACILSLLLLFVELQMKRLFKQSYLHMFQRIVTAFY